MSNLDDSYERFMKRQTEMYNRLAVRAPIWQRNGIVSPQNPLDTARYVNRAAVKQSIALAGHLSVLPVRSWGAMFRKLRQAPLLKHRVGRRAARIARQSGR